ncbi:hypothetical protein [Nocardia concava]|uniref:hypothetical protein n=1 Tax=Nocardia concava TaxID=257281 RepID=UPI0012FA5AD4|nr:hypothetical protein [Nocardia concava]
MSGREKGFRMTSPSLVVTVRELSALPEQIEKSVRPHVGNGVVLEVGTSSADMNTYRDIVRTWRTPIRLLLITIPDGAAADHAYDDWVHWIAGGGLLAIQDNQPLHERAVASGKFRELPTSEGLRILQRIAACN